MISRRAVPVRAILAFLVALAFLVVPLDAARAQAGPGGPGGFSGNPYPGMRMVEFSGAGHVPCRDNEGTVLPATQFETSEDAAGNVGVVHQWPTAVKRGQTVTVTLTLQRSRTAPGPYSGQVTLQANYGFVTPVPISPSSISVNMGPGAMETRTFTVGPFPDHVNPRESLFLGWQGDGWLTGLYDQPLYIVHGTPKAPQEKPWLGVLDHACEWAKDQNTDDTVARELTLGMFHSYKFLYPASTLNQYVTENGEFRLTRCLGDLSSGQILSNCADVSSFLTIGANALGLDFSAFRMRVAPAPSALFTSNAVCLIGYDPGAWPASYGSKTWEWHQVARPTYNSNSVYDVCAAQYLEWFLWLPYLAPPIDWPVQPYWQASYQYGIGLVAYPPGQPHLYNLHVPTVL